MKDKRTLVIGASTNPERYSNMAIRSLRMKKIEVVALAKRPGVVDDVRFETSTLNISGIHTVSLYVGPDRQKEYYEFLIQLKPVRVIFNPGTENRELENLLEKNGIYTTRACTLVLLSTNQF